MPAGVSDSATAQRLDDVLALRDLWSSYKTLPSKGFTRLTSLATGATSQHKLHVTNGIFNPQVGRFQPALTDTYCWPVMTTP